MPYLAFLKRNQAPFLRDFYGLYYYNDTIDLDPYDPAKKRRVKVAGALVPATAAGTKPILAEAETAQAKPAAAPDVSAPASGDAVHAATVALARAQDPQARQRSGFLRAWTAVSGFCSRHDFWTAMVAMWAVVVLVVGLCVTGALKLL